MLQFFIHKFKKVSGVLADSYQKANQEGYNQLNQKYADFSHLCMNVFKGREALHAELLAVNFQASVAK